MSNFIEISDIVDIKESIRLLIEKIGEAAGSFNPEFQINRIRLEVSAESSLIDWLKTVKADSKIYWSGRNNEFEMAGIGIAQILTAEKYDSVENVISKATRLVRDSAEGTRIYGGIRFPADAKKGISSDWKPLGAVRFIIPRLELIKSEHKTEIVCNVSSTDLKNPDSVKKQLDDFFPEVRSDVTASGPLVSRLDMPNFDGWESVINSVVRDFGKGKIEKIVLARQTSIKFKENCDGFELLRKLSSATPKCFHFCFQPANGTMFLGASPELLYSRHNKEILSEALAGTKPRGNDNNSDQALESELLSSEKELREHKYVVDNIKAALTSLCENFQTKDTPSILKLAQVQHLRTEFRGKLRPGVLDADIIGALHPTSAVGGFPSAEAQTRIAQYEEFDRGWYAGAVGWLSKEGAEMAVAIRSGLVNGKELKLHSGAGIIKGSTPKAEWDEIESKIASFLNAVSG